MLVKEEVMTPSLPGKGVNGIRDNPFLNLPPIPLIFLWVAKVEGGNLLE